MTAQSHSTPRRSPFLRYLTIALIICLMPFFVLGATVAATGTVTVDVEEHSPDGVRLWIPVPALLLDLAVFAAPMLVPDDAIREVRREIAPFYPALQEMAEALEDCPDGVLVQVDGPDEKVRIIKDGGSFVVDVKSSDADVHVTVPARLLGRALDLVG